MDIKIKPYTPDPVPVKEVTKWLVILMVMVVVTIGVARAIYPAASIRLWSRYQGGNTAPFSARQAPPNGRPRLQVDEAADYEAYLRQQKLLLETYAWADKNAGTVRMPVEQAMKRLLEIGLPVRKGAQP